MRKILPLLLFINIFFAHSQQFQITGVSYTNEGNTRESAIEELLNINQNQIFNSYEELQTYTENLKRILNNERNFSSSEVILSYESENADNITPVSITIHTTDSKHLIIVPYPKYDSNIGTVFKIKLKDTNFLGTLSTLSSDVYFELNEEEIDLRYILGFNFDYAYPFTLGKIKSSWNNSFSVEYVLGDSKPEFTLSTGLTFEYPVFEDVTLKLDITQFLIEEFDYEKFNDDLFFREFAMLSLPLTLCDLREYGMVIWSPFISYTKNWDYNGIDQRNTDLAGQRFTFGNQLDFGTINWEGNFRNGISCTFGQSIQYNVLTETYDPRIWIEALAMKAWDSFSFSSRWYFFASHALDEIISERLRGIKDEQYYENLLNEYDEEILSVDIPCAMVVNLDLPIHIVNTDWLLWLDTLFGPESTITKRFQWLGKLNFELQIAPFIDAALTKNKETGTLFAFEDGFYTCGMEMIVFPERWRSIEVRASFGLDAGRKILYKIDESLINMDWREDCKDYEIYIGIGLHY